MHHLGRYRRLLESPIRSLAQLLLTKDPKIKRMEAHLTIKKRFDETLIDPGEGLASSLITGDPKHSLYMKPRGSCLLYQGWSS